MSVPVEEKAAPFVAFRHTVEVSGIEVQGITLAGATITYGASQPFTQPEPSSAHLELVTSDAIGDADDYPGFTYGAAIPSGFIDEYHDKYEGPDPQLEVGAPVAIIARTPSGFIDRYVDDYLAGYESTRFVGVIAALDYTPGLVAVTAVSNVERLRRITVSPAGFPLETDTARVTRIATAAGVPITIEGPDSATILPAKADANPEHAWTLLAKVADDSDAILYGDRGGRVIYRTRNAPPRGPAADIYPGATLVDSLKMTRELGTVTNDVTVKAGTIVAQVEDADSIARYGRRARSWNIDTDETSARDFAARRLARYKSPYWHMPTAEAVIELAKTQGGSAVAAILDADLDDEVLLPMLLPASPVPSYASRLIGYTERIDPYEWRFTISLDPYGWSLIDAGEPPYVPPPIGPSENPQLEHTGAGLFTIRNYLAGHTYTATKVAGGGTATLDTVTGVYTISDPNSRWAITTEAAGSKPGWAERKAYTFHSEDHGRWEVQTHQVDRSYPARAREDFIQGDPPVPNNASGQCPPGWTNTLVGMVGGFTPVYACCITTTTYVCDTGGTLDGTTCRKYETVTENVWVSNIVSVRDATPSGYQDNHGEWARTV